MFDPFGDFESAGYLRNVERSKDMDLVKAQEHLFFSAHLEEALDYLSPDHSPDITYQTFLDVHRMLFGDFYPWAGSDRLTLGVGMHVGKGNGAVEFERADLSRQAVEWGLRMSCDMHGKRTGPGDVMGAFAWGHPFLDGNGRAMLLVHTELCARAGFAIDWGSSKKDSYLQALTDELWNPGQGKLNEYFVPLIRNVDARLNWRDRLLAVQGLDGSAGTEQNVAYRSDDPEGPARYATMDSARRR
ncbi:cell filamentation protein [Burkholderia sp. Bp8963]|uniref:Fic family protein n=1 Tax=Burkholderia sp. Bp8963 TaxID=2184547 RepID=UPI000F593C93|nr:Fic family protein [Burkholderia sp. Bp8963]RQS69479.1 cell filamentation protein [Burkholderia sp. Bp8963]